MVFQGASRLLVYSYQEIHDFFFSISIISTSVWGMVSGLNYVDLVAEKTGVRAQEISIGPLSSIHDRACEVWARVHNSLTDFGYHHSERFGHDRYGRDFSDKAIYKPVFQKGGLGEIGSDNRLNRVFLVGHSLGGLTSRYFERTLHQGLASEYATPYPDTEIPISPFFQKGRNATGWIRAFFGLSVPFDGSPLPTRIGDDARHVLGISIAKIFSKLELVLGEKAFYTLDLEHFGFNGKQPGESWIDVYNRYQNSIVLQKGYCDTGGFDIIAQAQVNFNMLGPRTYPGTHYLAFATHQSREVYDRKCGFQFWKDRGEATDETFKPLATELIFQIPAALAGDLTDVSTCQGEQNVYKACVPEINITGPWTEKGYEGFCFGNEYEFSDGLVPFIISAGPRLGYPDDNTRPKALGMVELKNQTCKSWDTFPENQWHYIQVERDHLQVAGLIFQPLVKDVNNLYGRDISMFIDRLKYDGEPEKYVCCKGDWCQQSLRYIPPLYPSTFTDKDLEALKKNAKYPPEYC